MAAKYLIATSNFGRKLSVTQPIFCQIQWSLFCFVAGDQFSTLNAKELSKMIPGVYWLQRNDSLSAPRQIVLLDDGILIWECWEDQVNLSQHLNNTLAATSTFF